MNQTVRETFDDADGMKAAIAEISGAWPSPSTFLSELKRDISEYLQRAGFPHPGDIVFHKGRFWCQKSEGEQPIGKAACKGWAYIQKQTEPLSWHHEAAKLYLKAVEAESALRCGDVDRVFSHSLLLGIAHAQFRMRWHHLENATSGKKFRKASAAGAALRRGTVSEQTRAVLAEMKRLLGAGHTETAAASIAAAKGVGTSGTANRALWQRHKKKPVTKP